MKVGIIGSGISSLYTAYSLHKKNIDFNIFEKNSKIGGRIEMIKFDNLDVVSGAGIGRLHKDALLFALCKELDAIKRQYTVQKSYTFEPVNVKQVLSLLKKHVKMYNRSDFTFKQFATKVLGDTLYKSFTLTVGETDYENADFIDTLQDYGFEHFNSNEKFDAFAIDWNKLLDSFLHLFKNKLYLNTEVTKLYFNQKKQKYVINDTFFYDKVVFGTEISTIQRFFPLQIFKQIKCQSFVRLYCKFDKSLLLESPFVITHKPFQKIIEINKEQCVYMISYCDNKYAENWLKKTNLSQFIEKNVLLLLKQKVKVLDSVLIYWDCGTHYYKPLRNFKNRHSFLKQAQNPYKDIFIVGEAFSQDQGWCEGALQSVVKIIHSLNG